ncbi:MAG: ATP-binding protein [Deltaproteobacteria bacterium]|nr:ATP-binding protein [Deltaproteobacteria bacterium]
MDNFDIFWEKRGWETSDIHLNKLKAMPFCRDFPFIPQKNGLYIIRGPRQIGKSSWLKTILSQYSKVDAKKCFYFSCENIRDHLDLEQLLKSTNTKKLILLDEISFVRDWSRAIKHYVDQGHPNVLVITGSDAHDLRKGADRMPGRFGKGGEFSLLPMDFFEFLKMKKIAGWKLKSKTEELLRYFKTGGFPPAVAEAGPDAKKPVYAIETYWKWLSGDFARRGKQEIYLREVLSQLALTLGSSISLQGLAAKTQIGSHHTVQEYLSLLEDSFALRTLYSIEPNTGAYQFKKEKKFYFTDPLLFWLALDLVNRNDVTDLEPRLAEMCACEFLSRKYSRFGYYGVKKGEIDFFAKDRWAIEVKWSEVVHNVSEIFKNLKIPHKVIWYKGNFFEDLPAGQNDSRSGSVKLSLA